MASPRPQGLSPSKKQTNEKPSGSLLAFNQIKPQGLEPQVSILPLLLACSGTLGKWLCPTGPQFPFLQFGGREFPTSWGVYKD